MQAVASLADINDKHVIDVLNPNLTGSLKVYNALYGLSIEALSTIGFRSGTAANIPGVPSIAVASSGQNAKKVSANQEKHMLKTVLDCLRKMTSVKIVGEKFFEKVSPPQFLIMCVIISQPLSSLFLVHVYRVDQHFGPDCSGRGCSHPANGCEDA